MHPIARRSLKTLAWVVGICATIILAWFGFWMYPGLTPNQTAGILVKDPKFANRALTIVPLWGDRLLLRLREQSLDFTRMRPRNSLLIAGILADRRSDASRQMSGELFARDSLLPKMIGAVGLAAHGLLPAAEFKPGGTLQKILVDERLFAEQPDSVGFYSNDEYVVMLAIEAAKRARARESVPDVARLLSSRQDGSIKERAAAALGAIGDPSAVEPLRHALRDSTFHALSQAFRALVALGDSQAVPLAIERLEPRFDRWGYLLDAVRDVTDEDFGYDRDAWRRWWGTTRQRSGANTAPTTGPSSAPLRPNPAGPKHGSLLGAVVHAA